MANSHILVGATTSAQPVVRRISPADIYYALARGIDDFTAVPSHAVFLCVIYPLLGDFADRRHFGKFAVAVAAGIPDRRRFRFGRTACRHRSL